MSKNYFVSQEVSNQVFNNNMLFPRLDKMLLNVYLSRLLCISMLSKWRQAYVSHHFFRFKESLEVFPSTHILNISALWIYAPYITFSLYLAFIHLCKREKEAAQCNAFDIYCCSRRYTANFWSVNREKKHLGNVKSYL